MSIDPTPTEPDNTTPRQPVDRPSQDRLSAQMGLILGTSVAGFVIVIIVLIIVLVLVSAGVYRKLRATHALANQRNGNTATLDGMYN